MGVEIGAQASALACAFLLGVGFALVYDLLRALRLRRRTARGLTDALDVLFTLLLAAGLLAYTRRIGGGELRLYMLFAALAGAAVFFVCFAQLLRPLWDFWAALLFSLLDLLRLPLRVAAAFSDKLHKRQKRLFLFYRKSFIIKNWGRFSAGKRRTSEKKEGISYGGIAEKAQKRRVRGRTVAHAGAPSGRSAHGSAGADQNGEAAGG